MDHLTADGVGKGEEESIGCSLLRGCKSTRELMRSCSCEPGLITNALSWPTPDVWNLNLRMGFTRAFNQKAADFWRMACPGTSTSMES